jgi:branched-chain amino acid transport system substrate-binding protein
MSDSFIKAYKAKYGQDAVPDSAAALGFDAYMIAIDSLNKTGTALDGEALRATIANTREFPGSSGTITLDINGDPIKSVVVKKIVGGQAVSAYTMEPAIVNISEISLQQ